MQIDLNRRRVKIVCTLGPNSSSYEQILALAQAGMDVARLNFSHGTYEDHQKHIDTVRRVSDEVRRPIVILQDLQGPKIRVGRFENGSVMLEEGAKFTLTVRNVIGTQEIAPVSYSSFNHDVKSGDTVLLDDGHLVLQVEEVNGPDVHCRVIYGGKLSDKKGLNLPDAVLSVEPMTDKDKADLEFGLAAGVDYVALSFVQKASDIRMIKSFIDDRGYNTPVIAKIEKPQAVQAIDDIAELTDGIMIARGDLGVEMPPEEVPAIQKEIIRCCNRKGVPVITATQMLDSMIQNPRPTRAEASDVANAVLDGTDAVMLSGETAVGRFPVESVETMGRIIVRIEDKKHAHWRQPRGGQQGSVYPTPQVIGYSACQAAELVDASAIICLTQSGSTAGMIAQFRPHKPIVAITPQPRTLHRCALFWGVSVYLSEDFGDNIDIAVTRVLKELKSKAVLHSGDKVVLTAGLPFNAKRTSNMIRIEEL
ncbi:MAG: pyruvate kinase [Pseudomonadota bacterium]